MRAHAHTLSLLVFLIVHDSEIKTLAFYRGGRSGSSYLFRGGTAPRPYPYPYAPPVPLYELHIDSTSDNDTSSDDPGDDGNTTSTNRTHSRVEEWMEYMEGLKPLHTRAPPELLKYPFLLKSSINQSGENETGTDQPQFLSDRAPPHGPGRFNHSRSFNPRSYSTSYSTRREAGNQLTQGAIQDQAPRPTSTLHGDDVLHGGAWAAQPSTEGGWASSRWSSLNRDSTGAGDWGDEAVRSRSAGIARSWPDHPQAPFAAERSPYHSFPSPPAPPAPWQANLHAPVYRPVVGGHTHALPSAPSPYQLAPYPASLK